MTATEELTLRVRVGVRDAPALSKERLARYRELEGIYGHLIGDVLEGTSPGFSVRWPAGNLWHAVTRSLWNPGSLQVTDFADGSPLGDRQYPSVEAALAGEMWSDDGEVRLLVPDRPPAVGPEREGHGKEGVRMGATWNNLMQATLLSAEDVERMGQGLPVEEEAAARTGASASRGQEGPLGTSQPPVRHVDPGRRTEDFGEKIGGARKDLWAHRGLTPEDLEGLTGAERAAYATKRDVWPPPDWQAELDRGVPREVIWFQKRVRDAAPTRPEDPDQQRAYVEILSDLMHDTMAVRTLDDAAQMGDWLQEHECIKRRGAFGSWVLTPYATGTGIGNPLLRALRAGWDPYALSREADRRQFLFTDRERALAGWTILTYDPEGRGMRLQSMDGGTYLTFDHSRRRVSEEVLRQGVEPGCTLAFRNGGQVSLVAGSTLDMQDKIQATWEREREESRKSTRARRKGQLRPPQLEHVERFGPPTGRPDHVVGQDFLDDFGIRGGEFGNWMSEQDRRWSLDMAWDAFHDMALAWDVDDRDVSLGGHLAIAFGARGRSRALAHYEPLREVINLTKMKGAGSLAHEMVHAAHDVLGAEAGIGGIDRARDFRHLPHDLAPEMRELYDAMTTVTLTGADAVDAYRESLEADVARYREGLQNMTSASDDPGLEAERQALIDALVDETRHASPAAPNVKERSCRTPAWDALAKQQRRVYEASGRDSRTGARTNMERASNLAWAGRYAASIAKEASRLDDPESIGPIRRETKYYADAKAIDGDHAKAGHGYWASPCEMLARAGAVITRDRLEAMGIRDDYLVGHAGGWDTGLTDREGIQVSTVPLGAERERIAQAMDRCVDRLKELGLLHERGASHDRGPTMSETADAILAVAEARGRGGR